jgi:hypothetical protein
MHTIFLFESLMGGDHSEDLGVDSVIILEWIFYLTVSHLNNLTYFTPCFIWLCKRKPFLFGLVHGWFVRYLTTLYQLQFFVDNTRGPDTSQMV